MLRSRKCLIWSSMLAALVAGGLIAVLVLQPWNNSGMHQLRFRRAAVAANGYECASIGRGILERNGTAVDAAIATLFCEGLACAQCMGLGGGFLATVYDANTHTVRVLNARERAPAAATEDMFQNASSTVGGLAIAVPGELRGYGELYKEYGRLPWRELVRPAADLCRRGHRVNNYMGRVLKTYRDRILAEPSMREIYVNPETGDVWNEGDLIREPTLARTLDIIAEEGPEAIHDGTLTTALVRDIQDFGGIITEEDLRSFKAEWQEPIGVQLSEEHTLYSVPLPGSGSVLAFMLNMMRGWVGAGSSVPVGSDLYWHRVVETFKYAYAKRTGLGDPARTNLPYDIRELERNLSDREWARGFRRLVDDNRTFSDWRHYGALFEGADDHGTAHVVVYAPDGSVVSATSTINYIRLVDDNRTFSEWRHYGALFEGADDHGTAHVVVYAPDGSVVSATSTINYIWGSQRRSRSLGIMLNNEMDDFAIPNRESAYGMPPSPANMVAKGLQPLSSMVPSVVLSRNGTANLVIGAAGGTKITTQVALVTMHTLLENDGLSDVIQRPRLHHQLVPMEIEHETNFSPSVIEFLRARGHATTERGPTAGFAAMNGAQREANGYILASTDRRRVGSIDGF